MNPRNFSLLFFLTIFTFGCSKNTGTNPTPPTPTSFSFTSLKVNGTFNGFTYNGINTTPVIKFSFSAPINHSTVNNSFLFKDNNGGTISFNTSFENNDSNVVIQLASPLSFITKYNLTVSTSLTSQSGGSLQSSITVNFTTAIDTTDKFPTISDNALLDLVQQQTFKYFWDFAQIGRAHV